MDKNNDQPHIEACLKCGQAAGQRLEVTAQYPEGVAAKQVDGKQIFLSAEQLALLTSRNRGRG